jgi:tetratricopeptide (TPR) repeat protein
MSAERPREFQYSVRSPPTEGPLVELSLDETEQFLLKNLRAATGDRRDALWQLARFYSHTKRPDQALDYLRQVMALPGDTDHTAACILAMGQSMEQVGDFPAAIRYYREAFALEPLNTSVWYLINNNLGFSLNTLGQFVEGESYCRAAINIDPRRPNAFKNLGIALRGQGRLAEAGQCFIQSTQANASDTRSLALLEELLARHPELGLLDELAQCRQAVDIARRHGDALQPVIHRGFRKHLVLLRERIKRWFKPRKHRHERASS